MKVNISRPISQELCHQNVLEEHQQNYGCYLLFIYTTLLEDGSCSLNDR